MISEKLGILTDVKTGKLDANAQVLNGQYPFFTCSVENKRIDSYAFDGEYVIVAGNGDLNVKYYNGKFNAYQRTYAIKPNNEIDGKYLYYFLEKYLEKLRELSIGGVIKYIKLENLTEARIPLQSLDQQKKIAAILDAADVYKQKTKVLIDKYDELTQSLFLETFGDPVTNPKNWEIISLGDYGSFKNGLNFGRNESGVKLKYLGVGNFKSFYKIDDLDTLSSIELNNLPSEGYLLKDGDLVFVRSNGNKALVGRCIEIICGSTMLTFSGFCIRYRLTSDKVKPSYLAQLFRNKSFKSLMLKGGRGANIQNINQKILSEIKIPVPETSLQDKFIASIKAIELQKAQAQASLAQAEDLFNSLLQRAFKGESTS